MPMTLPDRYLKGPSEDCKVGVPKIHLLWKKGNICAKFYYWYSVISNASPDMSHILMSTGTQSLTL